MNGQIGHGVIVEIDEYDSHLAEYIWRRAQQTDATDLTRAFFKAYSAWVLKTTVICQPTLEGLCKCIYDKDRRKCVSKSCHHLRVVNNYRESEQKLSVLNQTFKCTVGCNKPAGFIRNSLTCLTNYSYAMTPSSRHNLFPQVCLVGGADQFEDGHVKILHNFTKTDGKKLNEKRFVGKAAMGNSGISSKVFDNGFLGKCTNFKDGLTPEGLYYLSWLPVDARRHENLISSPLGGTTFSNKIKPGDYLNLLRPPKLTYLFKSNSSSPLQRCPEQSFHLPHNLLPVSLNLTPNNVPLIRRRFNAYEGFFRTRPPPPSQTRPVKKNFPEETEFRIVPQKEILVCDIFVSEPKSGRNFNLAEVPKSRTCMSGDFQKWKKHTGGTTS